MRPVVMFWFVIPESGNPVFAFSLNQHYPFAPSSAAKQRVSRGCISFSISSFRRKPESRGVTRCTAFAE